MSYSGRMQNGHYYSVFFAPRGRDRMYDLGIQIAQMYLSPFDKLIGVIGEAGSGKSMIIKGMFPGLELTNDDNGLNVRPLPLLDQSDDGFFSAHTYHIDINFEAAFVQMHELADAILNAVRNGKRVIVEHFDMIYPYLHTNADLLIGVGEEVIINRPTIFGPLPGEIHKIVAKSIVYRRMAHSAEDLCEIYIPPEYRKDCRHGDVKHGFVLEFSKYPGFDLDLLEKDVLDAISRDVCISYVDEKHIMIGDILHPCTGPRTHVPSTGSIENFRIIKHVFYDPLKNEYMIAGRIGPKYASEESYDFNDLASD